MSTVFKTFAVAPTPLGPRTIRVVCSDATIDLAGEVVVPDGIDLSCFMRNPVVLWSHNPEHPIGTMTQLGLSADKLVGTIEFYPEGVSKKSDEVCALTKIGAIKGVSIGFDPVAMAPMDPSKPRGPQRYTKSKLMEVSVVAIPANPSAEVIQRAQRSAGRADPTWKCGAAADLPVKTDGDWDGAAAANSIFDEAGFNDDRPDPDMARRGFLAYDSSKPKLRGSYKLPFAMVVNGKLTAMASGLRAAANRLADTDIPDTVRAQAANVLKKYGVDAKGFGGMVHKEGRTLSGQNAAVLADCHDLAEKCRAGIATVLEGASIPYAGSPQNPGAPPSPGAGSGQHAPKSTGPRLTKAERQAAALALAPIVEAPAEPPTPLPDNSMAAVRRRDEARTLAAADLQYGASQAHRQAQARALAPARPAGY